ncbi:MAG: YdcF family protein [Clostridia bacterium]|nr:YdcF family protein [Clostridia bacterium]
MIVLIIFILIIISIGAALALYGRKDNAVYTEDAVIVLGKGLDGDKVPVNLAKRLDKAIEYHEKNPRALIVVSGGKGDEEKLSEAQAMTDYLLQKGVPENIIIKEDKSTTTYENFVFSTDILNEKLGNDYSVAFISNSFHIYRAEMLAKELGINAAHLGAGIEWHTVPANYLREISVLFGLIVLKKK